MVSLGAREAILTVPDGCIASALDPHGERALLRVRVEERESVAAVGSGDAFLAGLFAARYAGRPMEECLRHGVACGAESTQHLGAGLVDPAAVERIEAETHVERLSQPAEVG